MNNEKEIINRCRKEDSNAQKEIFEKYSPIMMGVCMRYLKDKHVASDIMQEGFIVVFTKISQYKGLGSFEGWIKRIMINLSLRYLKIKAKTHFYDIDELDKYADLQANSGEQNIDFNDKKSVITNTEISQNDIFNAVAELPDGFRTVFNLYVMEGYKHKEIAKELGISINTSKTQLLRARKQLQDKLYLIAIKKQKQKNIKFYKEVI